MNSLNDIKTLNSLIELINSENVTLSAIAKEMKSAMGILIDRIEQINLNQEGIQHFKSKKLAYEWSEEAKQLAILLRDVLLRRFKDHHKLADKIIDQDKFLERRMEESTMLQQASRYVDELYETINRIEEVDESFVEKWKHQFSPHEVIKQQIEHLQKQLESILVGHETLIQLREDIKTNQSKVHDNFIWINNACDKLKDYLQEARLLIDQIVTGDSGKKMSVAIVELDKIYKKIEQSRPLSPIFNFETSLSGISVIPIADVEGRLIVKEINFDEHINSWIESDLYSSYLDEKSIIDSQYDNVLISIFNIRNRISVLESEDVEDLPSEINSLLTPLIKLDEKLTETDNNVEKYSEEILSQLDEAMVVSKIFDRDKFFFPMDGQAVYLDIKKGKKWLGAIPFEQLYLKARQAIRGFLIRKSDSGNALSTTIRYTDAKKLPSDSIQSKSLFFNKGYLGKSFYIHREQIEKKILDTYEYWKKGFGGSVLLHGSRLSGKSSILDALSDIITDDEIVKMKPGHVIHYLGRKFEPGNDLKSGLDFMIKHSISRRVIVLIDDLELWRGEGTSFYDNMVALQEAVSKFGRRMFFVVSTNNWMKAHLENHIGISNFFIVRISTNQMRINDIISAIKIRHAATYHGALIDLDENRKEQVIHNKARKISLQSNGNIGASLKEWGRNTIVHKEKFDLYQAIVMPDNVRQHLMQYRLILTHLFRFKQTSESELRTMIGDSFVREVNHNIQSLIGLGILQRSINGVFTINEMVIHEVESLIFEQKGKLSYLDE